MYHQYTEDEDRTLTCPHKKLTRISSSSNSDKKKVHSGLEHSFLWVINKCCDFIFGYGDIILFGLLISQLHPSFHLHLSADYTVYGLMEYTGFFLLLLCPGGAQALPLLSLVVTLSFSTEWPEQGSLETSSKAKLFFVSPAFGHGSWYRMTKSKKTNRECCFTLCLPSASSLCSSSLEYGTSTFHHALC